MMSNSKKSEGFGIVEILVALAILLVIGLIAWKLYIGEVFNGDSSQGSESSQVKEEPPKVEDEQDLEKSEEYLKDVEINSKLDTSEIDEVLN